MPVTVRKQEAPVSVNRYPKWDSDVEHNDVSIEQQAFAPLNQQIMAHSQPIMQSPTPQFMGSYASQGVPMPNMTSLPPNLVYQTPDGQLVTYVQQPMGFQVQPQVQQPIGLQTQPQQVQQVIRDDASCQTETEKIDQNQSNVDSQTQM